VLSNSQMTKSRCFCRSHVQLVAVFNDKRQSFVGDAVKLPEKSPYPCCGHVQLVRTLGGDADKHPEKGSSLCHVQLVRLLVGDADRLSGIGPHNLVVATSSSGVYFL